MTRSMTAFARQHRQAQDRTLCWELRSVNHRYLEVSVHLPEELRGLEITVREHVAAVVKRGKVECHLRLQSSPTKTASDAVSELPVNLGLV
ncbi:MAG TPA: YicC/YloC family endoribonuclease, partial [Gammaproteobacteria bacterium]|nr:YicC/YloC family endoribonuclease [Gammaproteobacteria bacterium]